MNKFWALDNNNRSRTFWLIVAFLALYVLLAWASFIRPTKLLGITPWNPQPALAVAMLLINRRWLPWVWIAQALAEAVVRGIPHQPMISLFTVLCLGLSYALMAWILSREGAGASLTTLRGLTRVVFVLVAGAALNGTIFVVVHALGGVTSTYSFVVEIGRYWIGDMVGFLVVLPTLMALGYMPLRNRLLDTLKQPHWWLVTGLIGLMVWAIFGSSSDSYFKYFYVLLLPVAWLSVRYGFPGATLTAQATQVWLLFAMQWAVRFDLTVFELQMLMSAVTVTGMVLGVVVDERERMAAKLQESLRLAAAGQTAAALAHELNQPLTALSTYAHATRSLTQQQAVPQEQMKDLTQRMVNEVQRAADIVKRLRDFFRTGSTQIHSHNLETLLQQAIDNARRRADAVGIAIEVEFLAPRPLFVKVDGVQWAVVMRNLLANAMDAVASTGKPGMVHIQAQTESDQLRLTFTDSGPGFTPQRLQTLFTQGAGSDKPEGMGIGLQISRAIVEAHGGQLWAQSGKQGVICLTLPLVYSGESEHGAHA